MTNINVDLAVEYVKNIVNNNKCIACDTLTGPYVRYPCGHFICQKCVATAEECLLCLTPPDKSIIFEDKCLSRRIEHISDLVTTFQDLFNIDVFRRHRVSEKLKLEKEIFPECIQAPIKYCNKRKSVNTSLKDKENIIPHIAGETTSFVKAAKMDDINNYVQHWLDTNLNQPKKIRKPFADLKVNCNVLSERSMGLNENNVNEVFSKKRTHNKKNSYGGKKLKNLPKSIKRQENTMRKHKVLETNENIFKTGDKFDNNESGIVIDDNTIVIEESQNSVVDKDRLACLAVREAEKNKINLTTDYAEIQSSSISSNSINIDTKTLKAKSMLPLHKVPFYKKSSLHEICSLCVQVNNKGICKTKSNNVKVTIENKNFIAIIDILHRKEDSINLKTKQSVEVQTVDVNNEVNKRKMDPVTLPNNSVIDNNVLIGHGDFIQDVNTNLFYKENEKYVQNFTSVPSIVKGVVVAESETDTDTDTERANTVETIADVHTSEQLFSHFGILSTLEPNQYQNRLKRKQVRSHSPISTDSSDKENYDPNRAKRQKFDKKTKKLNC